MISNVQIEELAKAYTLKNFDFSKNIEALAVEYHKNYSLLKKKFSELETSEPINYDVVLTD